MAWFEKIVPSRIKTERRSRSVPEGLWIKCASCDAPLYRAEVERNLHVCPKCGHHMRIGARERLQRFLDPGTGDELGAEIRPEDPLRFRDSKRYKDRLVAAQKSTGEKDAMVVMAGQLEGMPVVACAFEFQFLGGSMGSVVGEKLTRLIETATARRYPVLIVCASGGARMQEGMLSLMQMAKISGALERHRQAELLYMPLLTHPTTGGVTASFAMLGDLILAEPRALIGFAGRRVIEQTLREKLPDDFQTAEYLQDHGFVDHIVPRTKLRSTLVGLLKMHGCAKAASR